jgi:tripartite-type tricarboxylate transporter receptor subunit TctC
MQHLFAVIALIAMLIPTYAIAQIYPNRAVRFIVPYPAGGATDILSRAVGSKLSKVLGQQFIIDNRPGAGQKIGTQLAAKAAPDGYNILLVSVTHSINPSLEKNLPYDSIRDFSPVSLMASSPLILFINPSVKANTAKELIEFAKAQPSKLNLATSGNGSGGHLAGELFMSMAGVRMNVVPYKGGAPAYIDLMSGSVQVMFTSPNPTLNYARAGKLKAIATTGAKRSSAAPELPTVAESADLPSFESSLWYGLLAPAGTPKPIIQLLSNEVSKALQLPEVKEPLATQAVDVIGSNSDEFTKYIASETNKWSKVIKDANISLK